MGGKHIINSDMVFSGYPKNKKLNWHKSLGELFFNMPNFEI